MAYRRTSRSGPRRYLVRQRRFSNECAPSPASKQALRLDPNCIDPLAHHILMVERVYEQAEEFDLIHFHIDYLHFPLSRREQVPSVSTLHGRLDLPDLVPLYKEFRDMPVVSISDAQRKPLPWANWVGTVHHGLPTNALSLKEGRGGYLAFLGGSRLRKDWIRQSKSPFVQA